MTNYQLVQWQRFLNGHWQKQMPQKEGKYPQAAFSGTKGEWWVGETGLVYKSPVDQTFHSPKSWGGLWWSEPLPEMPDPDPNEFPEP